MEAVDRNEPFFLPLRSLPDLIPLLAILGDREDESLAAAVTGSVFDEDGVDGFDALVVDHGDGVLLRLGVEGVATLRAFATEEPRQCHRLGRNGPRFAAASQHHSRYEAAAKFLAKLESKTPGKKKTRNRRSKRMAEKFRRTVRFFGLSGFSFAVVHLHDIRTFAS
jgi:hypothetical protein